MRSVRDLSARRAELKGLGGLPAPELVDGDTTLVLENACRLRHIKSAPLDLKAQPNAQGVEMLNGIRGRVVERELLPLPVSGGVETGVRL